jgi:hypothetical protein
MLLTTLMGYPPAMVRMLFAEADALPSLLRSRVDLAIENAALRQQLSVLKQVRRKPRLRAGDRLFWVLLRRVWLRWIEVLIIVKPGSGAMGFIRT